MKHIKIFEEVNEEFFGPKMKKFFGMDNVPLRTRIERYLYKWDDIPMSELIQSMMNDPFYGNMPGKDMARYCGAIMFHEKTDELDAKYEPTMTKMSSNEFERKNNSDND